MSDSGRPYGRVWNYSAGPSVLPVSVLEQAQRELLNYDGAGMSILEMSHRSKTFTAVIRGAEAALRRIIGVPDDYSVLFMQGGGMGQFASVYLNLFASAAVREKQRRLGRELECGYLVTGSWSKGAVKEARRLGAKVRTVVDGAQRTPEGAVYNGVPDVAQWDLGSAEDLAYVYYCDNETIGGVEFPPNMVVDAVDPSVPVICDMSSNILSRPVDVARFGAIIAGAQKNVGPAGLTIAIVRNSLLERAGGGPEAVRNLPSVLDWKYYADGASVPHTPPCFSVYVSGLVFKWVEAQGIEAMQRLREARAKLVYDVIDSSPAFYRPQITDGRYRSKINIPFNLPTAELDAEFIERAAEQGMIQVKGHRSVGGIRVSLYNSMPLEGAKAIADFMKAFCDTHQA